LKKILSDPKVRAECERIEREKALMLDAILRARREAGLTQADIAARMVTKAPAVARLENALDTGKPSPSLAALRKYASAFGERLEIRFAQDASFKRQRAEEGEIM
jgi:transcriptional regulator with XRE-family HTH domain